ncbi:MAG: spiro-SPASM protein [Leptospiraceae bacterium]|nr:spiro-SPASM protein [Leptospiraceae bacterium]
MQHAIILIHTAAGYNPELAAEQHRPMLRQFRSKIEALRLPVFASIAEPALKAILDEEWPGLEHLPPQTEIALIRRFFTEKQADHVAVFNGIWPLFDPSLMEKLFAIHTEYRADITYGENLPPGIAPYWVSPDLLESLAILEAPDDATASGLRAFVEKNINHFHAEVHYEEPDLRLFRLDFSLATARSLHETKALQQKLDSSAPYAGLKPAFDADPALLVSFPSYIELEFCSTAEYISDFSPLKAIPQQRQFLERRHLDTLLDFLAQGFGDTSVCAGGLGEPLEHPHCAEYLQLLLESPHVRYVFVETNGIYLEKIQHLAGHAQAKKLRVIIFLNSLERFSELSGAPQGLLEKVKNNTRNLVRAFREHGHNAQDLVYVQALKVNENETEIDALYALAEELGASFLLQKYNRYAGLLPERRVSDMTPLERFFCWHLRRDLFIRANGEVALCKQTVDPNKKTARGHLDQQSLVQIWESQRNDFVANYRESYPPYLPCAQCDEYFTFNF